MAFKCNEKSLSALNPSKPLSVPERSDVNNRPYNLAERKPVSTSCCMDTPVRAGLIESCAKLSLCSQFSVPQRKELGAPRLPLIGMPLL